MVMGRGSTQNSHAAVASRPKTIANSVAATWPATITAKETTAAIPSSSVSSRATRI
jgi:hypothetical protein